MVLEKILDGGVDLNGYIMMFPIIIIVYTLTSSFMMQDITGLIYIFGIVFTLLNVYTVSSVSPSPEARKKNYASGDWKRSGLCYIGLPVINQYYNNVSPNAAIIMFTLFFFLMGDIANNIREMKNPFKFVYFLILNKPWLIMFFSSIFILNIAAERNHACNYHTEVDYFIGGGVIGLFTGLILMIFFIGTGMKNILQTSSFLNNATSCVIPTKKIFQCDPISSDDDRVYFLKKNETIDSIYVDSIMPTDVDTFNISTLKNFDMYEKIVMTGKTMVYFYEKENRKGRVIIINKDGDIKGKGKFERNEAGATERSTSLDITATTGLDNRTVEWNVLIKKFKTDWPGIENTFTAPQSIMIHKEY